MLNALLLILTLVATGLTLFYAFIYEASIPGGQYHYTYAGVALTAAVIFAALWLTSLIKRERLPDKILSD